MCLGENIHLLVLIAQSKRYVPVNVIPFDSSGYIKGSSY